MIIVIFGQPHSGKSTLAKGVQQEIFFTSKISAPIIDGDEIREIFKNKDFSKEGRIKNLQNISNIATFLNVHYPLVLVSAVYPLEESRAYLNELNAHPLEDVKGVRWVYLTYEGERGREANHVKDFEEPLLDSPNLLTLNTSYNGIQDCIEKICSLYWSVSDAAQGS